jgi:Ca2+-transporting ATPase
MNKNFWHNLSSEEVIEKLGTNFERGLSNEEVKKRQKFFGLNKFPEEKHLSQFKVFLEQFQNPLIYILIIAGIITLILGKLIDSFVIFTAVFLNAMIGFYQENKASKALRELKKIIKIKTEVIREGHEIMVDSSELVPGDIIILTAGNKVPADARIIENYHLKINEAPLTGEWLPAEKTIESLLIETSLADRDNMVYMSSIVEEGRGKAVITETGINTEIGKIAVQVQEARDEKTPLQKKIIRFSKMIGGFVLIICVFIFVIGILMGKDFLEMFIIAIALAVASVPEGLPMAITVLLTIGIQKILKRKGLIRKLLAVETLGSASIIATDKTLTLTEGRMKVDTILPIDADDLPLALKIITLSNEAFIENPEETKEKWIVRGRPTDKALLLAGVEAGINRKQLEKEMIEIDEIPFDPIHKYSARFYIDKNKNQKILYVCGAPEKLINFSNLNSQKLKEIEFNLENLTKKGLRVLAIAYQEYSTDIKYQKLESLCKELIFVGLIALKDPLRKDVKKAIKICQEAGMKPIIITGDHKLTAKAVANEVGLRVNEENIIEGGDLDKISDKDLQEKMEIISVYARAEPRHKMRIVENWQKKGEVVAMTGDGINDASALKKADIGVAVGSGADVAKEVADLVLLPDSFNIIVAAIEEGRVIIDNLRKVIVYLLATSISTIIIIIITLLFNLPLPILATQILWVNFLGGTFPAFALGMEEKEKGIMKRKPESKSISLLIDENKVLIFIIGFFASFILLILFIWLWGRGESLDYIRTMIFASLSIQSIFYLFSCRNLKKSLWQINPFSNRYIIGASIFIAVMLFLAIYFSFFQIVLKTVPLAFQDWLILLLFGIISLFLIEITKFFINNGLFSSNNFRRNSGNY